VDQESPKETRPLYQVSCMARDPSKVNPKATIQVLAEVVSKEADRLSYSWTVIGESAYRKEVKEDDFRLVFETDGPSVSFDAPSVAGPYRLSPL